MSRQLRLTTSYANYRQSLAALLAASIFMTLLVGGCALSPKPDQQFGSAVAKTAHKYLGVPYVYGGRSPKGFDCSGLTLYVYNQHGIKLPDASWKQAKYGHPIKRRELMPGDLVFFKSSSFGSIDHVGIYVGNGKFIHAPGKGKAVRTAELNNKYYDGHFAAARRVKK